MKCFSCKRLGPAPFLTWVFDGYYVCAKCWDRHCDGKISIWQRFERKLRSDHRQARKEAKEAKENAERPEVEDSETVWEAYRRDYKVRFPPKKRKKARRKKARKKHAARRKK